MSFFPTRDFLLEVARGKIARHSLVRVAGINPDVDTGEEDVVSFGGSQPWYTTTQALEIVSSSTDDAHPSGTGLRSVRITGLTTAYAVTTEDVNLNGTTAVDLVNSYIGSVKAEILTSGSGETNAGDVTIRLDGAGATVAFMPTGFGKTLDAVYTVPAGKTGYIVGWHTSIYKAVAANVEMRLMVADDTMGWRLEALHELDYDGTSAYSRSSSDLLIPVKAKGRVRVRCKSNADNVGVASSFSLIVVDN